MKYALLWFATGSISVTAWFFTQFSPWGQTLQEEVILLITRPIWLILAFFISPILQLLFYRAFLRGISLAVTLTVTGVIVSVAYWVLAPRSVVVQMGLSNLLLPIGLWALCGIAFLAAAIGMVAERRGLSTSGIAAIVLFVYALSVCAVLGLTHLSHDLVMIPGGSLAAAISAYAVMRRLTSGVRAAQ